MAAGTVLAGRSAHASLARARTRGIETCGRIAAFWGFTRTMGRTFGLLYLTLEPLPQSEIQDRLGVSKGSASMTLAALLRWGVVHKTRPRGQRRVHYRAETDFWKMISRVLHRRERREITRALKTVAVARADAKTARRLATAAGKREAEFVASRLAHLDDICGIGQTMLDMLLGNLRLDVNRFRDVFRA